MTIVNASVNLDSSNNATGFINPKNGLQIGDLQQFVPATNDYAGILAAYNAAVANGGGVVKLLPVTYNILGNSLPVSSGIYYVGSGNSFSQNWNATAGTIINGNNTAPAFWDGKSDYVNRTVTIVGNTVTDNGNGLAVGMSVALSGTGITLPTGVTANTNYYVVSKTTNTYVLGTYSGGVLTPLTASGTGAGTIIANSKAQFASVDYYMADIPASGGGIINLAIQNVTYGIKIGSLWRPGMWFYYLEQLNITNCTNWSMWLENHSLSVVRDIMINAAVAAGGDMFIGSSSGTQLIYNNNNSHFENVTISCTSTLAARHVVLSCRTPGTANNDTFLGNLQVNSGFYSVTATGTPSGGGSANISVLNSNLFPVDLPVTVTSSVNGLAIYRTYFVKTSASNVITISDTLGGAAKTFSATTALPLASWGYPHIEFGCSFNGSDSTGCQVQPFTILGLDLEGPATTSIAICDNGGGGGYIQQGTSNSQNQGTELASTYVLRNAGVQIINHEPAIFDIDYNAAGNTWVVGAVYDLGSTITFPGEATPCGLIKTTGSNSAGAYSASRLSLATGSYANNAMGGIFGINGGGHPWIYPANAIGQKITATPSQSFTLYGTFAGAVTYTGNVSTTWTLPTLSGTTGGYVNSFLGCRFEICNGSTVTGVVLTLATAAGQPFNRQTAKTTYAMALGASISVIAQTDGTTYWWQVTGNNGAT